MGTTRMPGRMLVAIVVLAIATGASCTKGSDRDPAPTSASNTTTSIPDEQKPPLLRDSWTPEDLAALAEIEVPNYENGDVDLTDTMLTRVFESDSDLDGVTLTAEVRLAPCDPYACWALAEEPDDDHLDDLRSLLPPVHQDDPDLVFEYEAEEVTGDFEALTLYWRSFVTGDNAHTIGYYVLYHDGLNLIEITLTPDGAPEPTDDEMLEAQMPVDWAREVAADVFAAYADEFNVDR